MNPVVKFKRLPNGDGLRLPEYATAGAAGMDLCAAEEHRIEALTQLLVPTGFAVEIPQGFEGQIRPRSGMALKHGVTVLNAPGTIDSDYRGEIGVLLFNFGPCFIIFSGQRIAQLVIAPVARAEIVEAEELDDTDRGEGGFGSTGVA